MANVREYQITVPNVAGGATVNTDLTLATGIQVSSVWAIKTTANGTAAATVQLQNGAGAVISDAISININDTTIARCSSIDSTNSTVTAAQGLRVACVNSGSSANTQCLVYCFGQPV